MPRLSLTLDPEAPHRLYEGVDYAQFWSGRQRQNLNELEHILVRKLLPSSRRRIIDVGCGYGRLADCYMGRFQEVVMVDGSMSLLHQAYETTHGQATYVACDATCLPFSAASFDAALMIRVFHHIEDSRTCLNHLNRILCNDGQLVFSYLNKQNALRVMRWLRGTRTDNPFSREPHGLGSTFISHHPRSVDDMLRESGFTSMQYMGAGVLDRLAGRISSSHRWVKPAELLAPILARSRIAPWILCGATAKGGTSIIQDTRVEGLLQCPSCASRLSTDKQGFLCTGCEKHYPIEDGIIDLRLQ